MCDVLDRVELRGEMRGEEKKAKETTLNLYKMGMKLEDIAKALNEAPGKVRHWLGIATA